MAFKIADAFVEVSVRYDRNRLSKAAREAGSAGGSAFSDSFDKRTSKDGPVSKKTWNSFEKDSSKHSSRIGRRSALSFLKSWDAGLKANAKKTLRKTSSEVGDQFARAYVRSVNKSISRADVRYTNRKAMNRQAIEAGEQFARNYGTRLARRIPREINRVFHQGPVPKSFGIAGLRHSEKYTKEFNKNFRKGLRNSSQIFRSSVLMDNSAWSALRKDWDKIRKTWDQEITKLGRQAWRKSRNVFLGSSSTNAYEQIGLIHSRAYQQGFARDFHRRIRKDLDINWLKIRKDSSKLTDRVGTDSGGTFVRGIRFGFEREFARSLPRAFNRHWRRFSDKDAKPRAFYTGRTLAVGVASMFGTQLDKSMERIGRVSLNRFIKGSRAIGDKGADRNGTSYGRRFGAALTRAFMPMVSKRSGIFRSLGMLSIALGGLGGQIGMLSTMAGAVASLGAALFVAAGRAVQFVSDVAKIGGLFNVLPAMLFSAGAAVGVLMLATTNLRKALFGSGEEAEEALAKIEDNVPAAADAIRNVRDAFSGVQKAAERAFLGPVVPGLNKIADRLIPALNSGIVLVAGALGRATNKMLEFLSSSESISFFEKLFKSTAKQIDNMSDFLPNVTAGLMIMAGVGLPFMERFATWLNKISFGFKEWAREAAESGKMAQWIENGIQAAKDFGAVLVNLARILGAIGRAAGAGGVLGNMRELTDGWATFLETAEGTRALETIFRSVDRLAKAFQPVLGAVGEAIVKLAPAFATLAEATTPILASVIRTFSDALARISPGVATIITEIAHAWDLMESNGSIGRVADGINRVTTALAPIVGIFSAATATVVEWISHAVDGFVNLVTPVLNLVGGLERFEGVLKWIGAAIILYFMTPLGAAHGVVLGIVAVLSLFSSSMDGRVRAAVLGVAAAIGAFFIPQLIAMGVAAVVSFTQSIRVMAMYAAEWVKTQIKMIAGFIQHQGYLWRSTLGWLRLQVQAAASSAVVAASWVRAKVAAVGSAIAQGASLLVLRARYAAVGVASLIATNGIAKGMAMAAASAVSRAGSIAASLGRVALNFVRAGAAAMVSGIKIAAGLLVAMGPVGWIIAAIAGIVAAFVILWNKSEAFRNFFSGIWEAIKTVAISAWNSIVDSLNIDGIKAAWDRMKVAATEAWDSIVTAVEPIIELFRKLWAEHGDKIVNVLKVIGGVFATIFGGVVLIVINAVMVALNGLVGIIVAVISTISGIVTGVINIVSGVMTVVKGIFTGDFGLIVDGIKQIFGGVLDIIKAPFIGAWEGIKAAWSGISAWFVSLFDIMGVDIVGVLTGVWNGIKNFFNTGWNWLKGIGESIKKAVIAPWDWIYNILVGNSIVPDLVNAIFGWFQKMWTLVKGVLEGFKNFVVTVFSWIYNAVVAVVQTLVQGVLALWRGLVNGIRTVLSGLSKFFSTLWNGIRSVVVAVVKGLVTAVRALFTGFVNGLKAIFNGLRSFFTGVWNGVRSVWTTIVNAIVKATRAIFTGFVNGLRAVFNGLRSFFTTVWNSIRSTFVRVATSIWNAVRKTFQAGVNAIKAVFGGVRSFFTSVWNAIRNTFTRIATAIWNTVRSVFQKGVNALRSLLSGLRNFFATVWNSIRNTFTRIATSIWNAVRTVFQKGVNALRTVFNGLRNFFTTAWNAIRNTFTRVVTAIWNAVRTAFTRGVNNVRNIFNRIRGFFTSVWNAVRNTFSRAVNAIWKHVRETFQKGANNIRTILTGIRNFFTTVWNAIRKTVRNVVSGLVKWVKSTFGSWIKWVQDKFRSLQNNIDTIWKRFYLAIRGVINRTVRWARQTIQSWVKWIYDKFNALKKNATNIWNSLRKSLQNVVTRLVNSVRNAFTKFVGWIYDKFNALRKNATRIWNQLKNAVEKVVKNFVSNVRSAFTKFVGWIYDKFNALKKNATNIWNSLRRAIQGVVDRVVKWVRNTFTKFVGWIYDKFNALKRNSVNIWNQMKNGIIDKITAFRDGAMKIINKFKDGVINAFAKARDGVGKAWDGLKKKAETPINWVIRNVFNNGILKLWNSIAKKIDLKELKPLKEIGGNGNNTHPAKGKAKGGLIGNDDGFRRGGVLPGKSTWRQGDDQMVPMRKGEGVAISEAMEIPALKNQLLTWNHVGVKKGKGALRRMAENGGGGGFATGGIRPNGTRESSSTAISRPGGSANPFLSGSGKKAMDAAGGEGHEGFAIGGVLKNIGKKVKETWSSIEGNLTGWATKPLDGLTKSLGEKYGKGQGFQQLPYHGVKKMVSNIKNLFQSKDDEFNDQGDDGGMGGFGTFTYNGKMSDHKNLRSTKPHVRMIGNFINSMFKPDTMWGMGGPPEHSTGRAIDYMVGTGKGQKRGDGISAYYLKHANDLGLQWVIWKQRIYNSARKSWRKMENRGDSTQNHMDHPHVFHKTSAPKAKDFISKQKGVKFSGGGGSGGGGSNGSGNTMMTSFWDTFQPMANGKRMSANSIASSVIPLGSKLRVTVGGKSANGSLDDLGPNSFVYRRHHPKALLDLAEPMMQKLTGRRSNVVNGSFKVTKKGSGRTLFGYTKWNGVFDPKKPTKGFAEGGMVPGSVPMGAGSHDVGGMLRDKHAAFNRSGEPETVHTLEQLKAIVAAQQNAPVTINIENLTVDCDDFDEVEKIVKFFNEFKKNGRTNGGRPQTRVNY